MGLLIYLVSDAFIVKSWTISLSFATAHPSIRLFVTHGGLNSVNEAIEHGVPMVGTTIFGDQPDNMVRVEAKNLGVSIQLQTLKAESFVLTMKEVIEDQRYAALWVVVP